MPRSSSTASCRRRIVAASAGGTEPFGQHVLAQTRPRLAEQLEQRAAAEEIEVVRVEVGAIDVRAGRWCRAPTSDPPGGRGTVCSIRRRAAPDPVDPQPPVQQHQGDKHRQEQADRPDGSLLMQVPIKGSGHRGQKRQTPGDGQSAIVTAELLPERPSARRAGVDIRSPDRSAAEGVGASCSGNTVEGDCKAASEDVGILRMPPLIQRPPFADYRPLTPSSRRVRRRRVPAAVSWPGSRPAR